MQQKHPLLEVTGQVEVVSHFCAKILLHVYMETKMTRICTRGIPKHVHTLCNWCPRQGQGIVDRRRIHCPKEAGIIRAGVIRAGVIKFTHFLSHLSGGSGSWGGGERERVSTLAAVLLHANGHTNSKT